MVVWLTATCPTRGMDMLEYRQLFLINCSIGEFYFRLPVDSFKFDNSKATGKSGISYTLILESALQYIFTMRHSPFAVNNNNENTGESIRHNYTIPVFVEIFFFIF